MSNSPTSPIPITGRNRSASVASSIPALSNSPTSPLLPPIQTPSSYRFTGNQPHQRAASDVAPSAGGSPTSPLAYFLGAATSPIRPTAGSGFPFSKTQSTNATAIDEDDGGSIGLFGVGAHTRRGSWAQNAPLVGGASASAGSTTTTNDRGTGVLRRLSLSGAFQRPVINSPTKSTAPPPSAVNPTQRGVPTLAEPRPVRKSRAASLAAPADPVKKRGISPMGERLLKGHFDGFI